MNNQHVVVTITPNDDSFARALMAVNQCRETLLPHLESLIVIDHDTAVQVTRDLRHLSKALQERISEDSTMDVKIEER